MLDIRTNLYNQITLKESDDTKGIGTIWNFGVLQDYIRDARPDKNIVPHLVRLMLREVEDISFITFTPAEKDRIEKDLTRTIIRLYYTKELRDYRVEIVDGYFKFYEGPNFLKTITVLRFERDLHEEDGKKKKGEDKVTTPKDVAISCINFIFEGRNITELEMDKLSDEMVELYQKWRADEDARLEELDAIRKRNKKK